ncbi:hypothetical protein [Methanobacterium oryzae]|uniref:hypothetical protein n=1 Tax=Methanobacterium oryzae TaxID=69540 RepID=UPI003D21B6EE
MKKDSDKEKNEKIEEKGSIFSSTKDLFKKLDFGQIPEDETRESKDSKNSKSEEDIPNHEEHAFPIVEEFLNSDRFKNIKSEKGKIITGIGLFIGGLFILGGIISMLGAADQIADNVVFGEKAVFSVFLILIGILIMAGVLARRFLDRSYFKGITSEIEMGEKISSNSTSENIKKDNINRNE